ncbi:hypothetical protein FQA39_LY07716 [Lamprigera yunnana]|nr:hypothetical protein FQA39_LY07716 [Lamprigera yunnana]
MNNRKVVYNQGRQIIYNVYQFMKKEKEEGLTASLSQLQERVAEATGMETRQKPRETEEQEKIKILQVEELEEPTKIKERSNNCKENKLMQMLLQMSSAMLNKLEEHNKKLEETMLNQLEENNQKLDETRTEVRTRMVQNMEIIRGQLKTIQERINEEKKYVEFDCKMAERKEQVDNNTGHINGNCENLKERKREIVNYVKKKMETWNSTENKMIMDYKEGEYRNFQESRKAFMKNYWGIKNQR